MTLKKTTSILLLIFITKFVSAQYNNDYYEVFYEKNVMKKKDMLFQNYWVYNLYLSDSIAKARKIKSMSASTTAIGIKFMSTEEVDYDREGRNTFSGSCYVSDGSLSSYASVTRYINDTGKNDYTYMSINNGKLDWVYQKSNEGDSLKITQSLTGKMKNNWRIVDHLDGQKKIYLSEEYIGRKEKLASRTLYAYYNSGALYLKTEYSPKGKLIHQWIYMDCAPVSKKENKEKKDTISSCRSTSIDKDGNTHEYITYTSLKKVEYKHEKIYNPAGLLIKHFTINQKTGHYYNMGEGKMVGDTLQYTYTMYNEKNGQPKYQYIYSYLNDKIVARENMLYKKKKIKSHSKSVFVYGGSTEPTKRLQTNYTEHYTTETIFTYRYY